MTNIHFVSAKGRMSEEDPTASPFTDSASATASLSNAAEQSTAQLLDSFVNVSCELVLT